MHMVINLCIAAYSIYLMYVHCREELKMLLLDAVSLTWVTRWCVVSVVHVFGGFSSVFNFSGAQ